jgi:hypothetical protein
VRGFSLPIAQINADKADKNGSREAHSSAPFLSRCGTGPKSNAQILQKFSLMEWQLYPIS